MNTLSELIIIGGSGHAKVVLSVALLQSRKIKGFLDDNIDLLNQAISGYFVLGNTSLLESHQGTAVLGIGNNISRKILAERYSTFMRWETLVHPAAYIHPSVKLGKGTVVCAGAIIQPDAVIGEHCIINTGATIDHDCIIGNYAHIAPGSHLAGNVKIGEGVFLGIGSIVIPGIKINDWAEVAAGGVVVKDIAMKSRVMGVPAKEII